MDVRLASALILAAAPQLMAACGAGGTDGAASATQEPAAAGDAPEPTGPAQASEADDAGAICSAPRFPLCSDGQILAILTAEGKAHVDLATAVRARVQGAGALEFAEKIVTDDSVLAVEVSGEARETGIAPVSGGIDREIAGEARDQIQSLAAESGATLDASYLDREALSHLRALSLVDRLLAPSARDPRIAALVTRVRGVIVQHTQAVLQARAGAEGPCGSVDGHP
jgi:predicted outer membrane protein